MKPIPPTRPLSSRGEKKEEGKPSSYAVDYQMYKSGSVWKIYNINVEGASLVTVYRNQFNEIIQKQGIDGLITALRNKAIKKVS